MTGPRELGFEGMLLAGQTPEQAWDEIRRDAEDPEVRAMIADMQNSEEGRAVLEWSRTEWERHGLPVPWEDQT